MVSKGLFKKKQGKDMRLAVFPSELIVKETKKTIESREYTMSSLSPKIYSSEFMSPSIPLIGIGGAGISVLTNIVSRIKEYQIDYQTAGIDLDWMTLETNTNLTHKLKLGKSGMGTAAQFRLGTKFAKEEKDTIKQFMESYLQEFSYNYKHDIIFFVLGSGGTGVGVGLESMKIAKEMGYRPVPILILPDENASTRVRFTAAAGLYYFSFAPGERSEGLMTILIDNQIFYENNKKLPEEELLKYINSSIGVTIGDLLISTEVKSDGYSTDLNEFLEVFRTVKGIGSIMDMTSLPDANELNSFVKQNMDKSIAYSADPQSSTRSYFMIQSNKKKVTAIDMRNTLSLFQNSDIFPKYSISDIGETEYFRVLSVFSGVQMNKRLRDLMIEAEDNRVDILEKTKGGEINSSVNQKIEKIKDGESIDVHTAEEIRDTLVKEVVAKRRGEA